jgi:hypothetical protein
VADVDGIPFFDEQSPQNLGHGGIVVDDENPSSRTRGVGL